MKQFFMIIFVATLMASVATPSVFAQDTHMLKSARHVRLFNREAVVYPNICIHPDPSTDQSETAIITHPLNPNIVLAGWNSRHMSGSVRSVGWAYTTDGGSTWVGRDTFVTHTNLSWWMVDPSVGIDLGGNLFFNGQVSVGTQAGSLQRFVARSTDRGTNWALGAGLGTPTNADKQHLTVDVNSGSSFQNYVYTGCTVPTTPRQIIFSRSTDSGQTFSTGTPISGSVTGLYWTIGANFAVGPNGELYAAWSAFDSSGTTVHPVRLGFNRSTDGGAAWGTAKSIRTFNYSWRHYLNKGGNSINAASLPSMAADRGNGPRRGWLYIVYTELVPEPSIYLIRSTDNGSTWSNSVKVSQDTTNNDHWYPWMSVDPSSGAIYVVYYDSREFPANDSAQVYLSLSTDGGDTFRDVLVSDTPFLPVPIPYPGTTGYMGDYIQVTALNGVVWPCWNDNRTGRHQAYTTRIVITSSVEEVSSEVPKTFALEQNFPNPFNPSTEIQFSLPQKSYVTLTVFDLLGREVTTLVCEELSAGSYSTRWDASGMPSGVYLYRLRAGDFVETRKLLLLR